MRIPRSLVAVLAGLLGFSSTLPAQNAVLEWNRQALDATRLSRTPPPPASMFLATMHVAMFDAANGVERQRQGWLVNEPAPAGINADAAIAGAAHKVMAKYWGPSVSPRFIQLAFEQALGKIPDGPAKADGIKWGEHVADLVLAKRADCGFDKPMPGPFSSTEPGRWRETPPGFRPATLPHWCAVTPFMMTTCSQFRAPPPPALDSKAFADDYAYVVKVGARDGAERTEYETLSSAFWSDDLGSCTPPGHWNIIAQDLATRFKLSTYETARLFALLNMTEADAAISCWDTKFFYRTWRPETAIREIDPKVNAHMTPNPDFIPNMVSPSFPSYTSGHSTFSAGASRLLEHFFGSDEIKITATSDGLPGAVRTFARLSEARNEIGMSRVWAGIHTMSDNLAGQECGMKIADWVFTNALPPAAAKPAAVAVAAAH